jgi:cytochrome b561
MSESTYTPRARHLHWSMAGLVLVAYLTSSLIDDTEIHSPERCLVIRSHFMAGLALLILLAPRVWHRLRHAPPPIEPPLAGWEAVSAKLAHGLLYAFLLAQPVLGVLSVWLGGDGIGIPLMHDVAIPSPLPENQELRGRMQQLHAWIGNAFYFVIGLHAAGALWHRFARRDDTLQRMLG